MKDSGVPLGEKWCADKIRKDQVTCSLMQEDYSAGLLEEEKTKIGNNSFLYLEDGGRKGL